MLGQASSGSASEVMAAEVNALCGQKYHPDPTDHFPAGSTPAKVIYDGDSEEVSGLRVRKHGADGTTDFVTTGDCTGCEQVA